MSNLTVTCDTDCLQRVAALFTAAALVTTGVAVKPDTVSAVALPVADTVATVAADTVATVDAATACITAVVPADPTLLLPRLLFGKLAYDAETSVLGWQWAAGRARVDYGGKLFELQRGHAKEAGLGALTGGAVTLFAVAVAATALPEVAVIGGGIAVGSVVRLGVEAGVRQVAKLWNETRGKTILGGRLMIRLWRRKRQPSRCRCGATPIPIAYGFPGGELVEAVERGEVHLGGCVVSWKNPAWYCPSCHRTFGRPARQTGTP